MQWYTKNMRMNASQAHTATGVPRSTVGRWIKSGKLPADTDGYFEETDFDILNAERITKPGPGRKADSVTVLQKKAPVKKKAPAKKIPAKKKSAKKKSAKKKAAIKKKESAPPRPTEEDFINQARILCTEAGDCSVAFIQRKINVGFARAQRISTTLKQEQEVKPGQLIDLGFSPTKNDQTRQGVDLRKALANAEKAEMEVKIKMKDLISRELVARVFHKIYAIDSTEWRGLGPRLAPDIMAVCEVTDPTKEVEISVLVEQQVFRTLKHVQRVINEFLEEIESDVRVSDEQ